MRLLQAIGGSSYGGAENFFMRLAPQLLPYLSQKVLIRKRENRPQILQDQGVSLKTCGFRGELDLKTRFQFFQEIRDFKPHIVLTWMNRSTSLCPSTPLLRKFLPPFKHVGRLGGFYNLKYYKNCDALIGNTKGIVNYCLQEGWPSEKVFYLPNFVDIPDLRKVSSLSKIAYGAPEKAPLFLAAGRLHRNKAFDVLIRSLVFFKDAYLWILGEGPEKGSLVSLARSLGVMSQVRFLGWQEDVSSFYKTATVFICPSRHEPLGNVILEAWAHQCPVVAAASSGPQELIVNEKTGLLYPIDEVEALVACLQKVLVDEKLRNKIAQKGYEQVTREFSQEKVVAQYRAFFKGLLEKKGRQ